jgi:hypothetical protein
LVSDTADESPEALFRQAKRFYFPSQGTPTDPELAIELFRRSAGLGYAPAQRLLGICLLEGRSVAADLEQARFWLTEAASRGDPQASLTLALVYAQGRGTDKRWDLAWSLLSRREVEAIPEARELKIRLKTELAGLHPELSASVAREEAVRRARLTRRQARFIPPFWPAGSIEGPRPEFDALLALTLGRISCEAAYAAIVGGMAAYYAEMTSSCPPCPSPGPGP